jgi:hypothetical protein
MAIVPYQTTHGSRPGFMASSDFGNINDEILLGKDLGPQSIIVLGTNAHVDNEISEWHQISIRICFG